MPINDKDWFAQILLKNGYGTRGESAQLLGDYVSALLEWNKKINLVSRASVDMVWSEHVLHSISPVIFGIIPQNTKIIDLGTGGGLPGIPVSIFLSGTEMTLLDSIKKKTKALDDIVLQLGLTNVKVVTGRAEELKELRNTFDVVLTRGVAPLIRLVNWSRLLLRKDGSRLLIAYKGGNVSDETQEARKQNRELKIDAIDIKLEGADRINSSKKKLLVVYL